MRRSGRRGECWGPGTPYGAGRRRSCCAAGLLGAQTVNVAYHFWSTLNADFAIFLPTMPVSVLARVMHVTHVPPSLEANPMDATPANSAPPAMQHVELNVNPTDETPQVHPVPEDNASLGTNNPRQAVQYVWQRCGRHIVDGFMETRAGSCAVTYGQVALLLLVVTGIMILGTPEPFG